MLWDLRFTRLWRCVGFLGSSFLRTLVSVPKSTLRCNPEDWHRHISCCEHACVSEILYHWRNEHIYSSLRRTSRLFQREVWNWAIQFAHWGVSFVLWPIWKRRHCCPAPLAAWQLLFFCPVCVEHGALTVVSSHGGFWGQWMYAHFPLWFGIKRKVSLVWTGLRPQARGGHHWRQ
jgi:hypothetical protein